MNKIYVLKKQKLIRGPYSLETIKQKGLSNSDMVWYEGLEDWVPAIQNVELAACIKEESASPNQSLLNKLLNFLK